MSKNVWFGTDVSPRESLFENGVLMRRIRKGEYEVFFHCGASEYAYGYFNFFSTVGILDDPDDILSWKEVGSLIGESGEEFRAHIMRLGTDAGAAELVSGLLGCYDAYDVLIHPRGCDMPVFSENEVKIRLNKALAA